MDLEQNDLTTGNILKDEVGNRPSVKIWQSMDEQPEIATTSDPSASTPLGQSSKIHFATCNADTEAELAKYSRAASICHGR